MKCAKVRTNFNNFGGYSEENLLTFVVNNVELNYIIYALNGYLFLTSLTFYLSDFLYQKNYTPIFKTLYLSHIITDCFINKCVILN
jgi:hypothetical protein